MANLTPQQFRAKYCKNVKPQKPWTSLDFAPLLNGACWGDCDEMPSVNELIKPRTISFTIEKPEPKKTETWGVVKPISLEEGEIDESDEPAVIPIVTPKKTVTWGYVATKTIISLEILEEGEIDESEEINVKALEKAQVLYPQIEFSIDDDERPPAIWRPAEHGYCLFCNYQIHSNPPSHFSPQQRKHCCAWCETSMGRGHGQHCQRCS